MFFRCLLISARPVKFIRVQVIIRIRKFPLIKAQSLRRPEIISIVQMPWETTDVSSELQGCGKPIILKSPYLKLKGE